MWGRKLSSVQHASDVLRIHILQQHGGIYLDTDTFLVKNLDYYRRFELAIGEFIFENVPRTVKITEFFLCTSVVSPMLYFGSEQRPRILHAKARLSHQPELILDNSNAFFVFFP